MAGSDTRTPAITLRSVSKRFGTVTAVDGVDLQVHEREFLTLLGPSGSGKTTVLRMIAGFELPTGGTIELGGIDVTRRPPFDRDVNTVFQDYALFPHLSVAQNIEYGLLVKKVGRAERRRRVAEMLDRMRLDGFAARKPHELSGGQRQRVALARALVNQPKVLLLDEPLGALDLKLREQMQVELKQLQRDVGITFVFVTHDQGEALTMSDRIAVFNAGRIEQIAAPAEVYERPATEFVAGFVGTSNLLRGDAARALTGRDGVWSIRPEKIHLGEVDAPVPDGAAGALGTVRDVIYLGDATRFVVDLDAGGVFVVLQQNLRTSSTDVRDYHGRLVRLTWRPEHAFALASAGARASAQLPAQIPAQPAGQPDGRPTTRKALR